MCSLGERLRPVDHNHVYIEEDGMEPKDKNSTTVVYTKFETKRDYAPEDNFCWGLCCLKGCIMGAIGITYIFIVLPTGVLLIFHGVNKRRSLTTHLGIGILCIPTILLLTSVFLYNYCRLKRKDARVVKVAKKRTLAFENPLSRLPGEEDVCQSMC